MRGSTEEALVMARTMIVRGVIAKTNDQPKMQEVDVRTVHGQMIPGLERIQTAGHTSVPRAMDKDGKGAEVLIVAPLGDLSQAIVVATDDRRDRPKNLRPGESAAYDEQGQISKIARDGIVTTGKKVTITGGGENPKGDTKDFELNEQLAGLAARVAQAENQIHGLFDVTSRFREIVQTQIPGVAAVAHILNKAPNGLDTMVQEIQGKAQEYLQKTVEQALQKFLNPNLAGLQSVLSAGLESAINTLKNEIAQMIAANPVIRQVDALREELSALAESGASPDIIRQGTAQIEQQLRRLTAGNPAISTVAALRSQLQTLVDQAGPGLNFLEPQKRLVQKQTRSMRFGGPG